MSWFCGPALTVLLTAGFQLVPSPEATALRERLTQQATVLVQEAERTFASIPNEEPETNALALLDIPMNPDGERVLGTNAFNLASVPMLNASVTSSEEKEASPGKTSAETEPPRLSRRVLVFKASWCGACQSLEYEWPKLRAVKWRIGTTDRDHFQFIDVDQHPELMARYGVASLPTLLLIENDREVSRAGGTTAWHMAEFYHGRE